MVKTPELRVSSENSGIQGQVDKQGVFPSKAFQDPHVQLGSTRLQKHLQILKASSEKMPRETAKHSRDYGLGSGMPPQFEQAETQPCVNLQKLEEPHRFEMFASKLAFSMLTFGWTTFHIFESVVCFIGLPQRWVQAVQAFCVQTGDSVALARAATAIWHT